jgi:hypothetical protein
MEFSTLKKEKGLVNFRKSGIDDHVSRIQAMTRQKGTITCEIVALVIIDCLQPQE